MVTVEVLEVSDEGDPHEKQEQESFDEIDVDGDKLVSREELSKFYRWRECSAYSAPVFFLSNSYFLFLPGQ
jgi:hypothetical protein